MAQQTLSENFTNPSQAQTLRDLLESGEKVATGTGSKYYYIRRIKYDDHTDRLSAVVDTCRKVYGLPVVLVPKEVSGEKLNYYRLYQYIDEKIKNHPGMNKYKVLETATPERICKLSLNGLFREYRIKNDNNIPGQISMFDYGEWVF